jgi:hypothetical protein
VYTLANAPPLNLCLAYLLACRTQPLNQTRVLIETGIRLLKQAVDNINNPPPTGIYGFDVGKLGTYNVRARCSILEKALREMKEARILCIQLRANFGIQRPLEGDVCVAYSGSRARGRSKGFRDIFLQRLEGVHGEFTTRSSSEQTLKATGYSNVSL